MNINCKWIFLKAYWIKIYLKIYLNQRKVKISLYKLKIAYNIGNIKFKNFIDIFYIIEKFNFSLFFPERQ